MMPPPNNTKGTMSRITIDVLERQAEHMGLKVLESDIPGTTCGLYCDRLRTIWLCRLVERPAEALHPVP